MFVHLMIDIRTGGSGLVGGVSSEAAGCEVGGDSGQGEGCSRVRV